MEDNQIRQIGFLGLGNMGKNMVYHLLDQNYEVYAWNRSQGPRDEVANAGAKVFDNIPDLLAALPGQTKVVWSMVAAGKPVDIVIEALTENENESKRLNEGDIFIDGVNSHFKETKRRGDMLEEKGINFLDCGVSGGIEGARNGACIMAGGNKEAFEKIEHIIKDLSVKNGYGYFGERSAGHYVKMVHNAIEYSMMQSIAEGINLLDVSPYEIDYKKLTDVWNHGSIIEGNLMGFLNSAFNKEANLESSPAEIGSLGTGRWAVEEALNQGVSFSSIANAVFTRYESRNSDVIAHKVISALRAEFGGHNEKERPQQEPVNLIQE